MGIHRQIRVVDPSGRWMTQWDKQFAALEIPFLRSAFDAHPAAFQSQVLAPPNNNVCSFDVAGRSSNALIIHMRRCVRALIAGVESFRRGPGPGRGVPPGS